MGLALGLGGTGYLMASGQSPENYEEVHELLANIFLAVVVLHIAGVMLHSVRHRDGFALSMVDGRKQNIDPKQTISGAKPAGGILFVAILAAFAVQLGRNYDASTQSLNLFGTTLQLGEAEGGERQAGETKEHEGERHGDDD